MSLKGRTALITGSTSTGMGRSTALRLAKEGANIVLNYGTHLNYANHDGGSDPAVRAVEVADRIRDLGGQAIVVEADTRSEEDTVRMVDEACKAFGTVDILVLAAGGRWHPQPLEDITLEHWRDVIQAEIDSQWLALKYVLPLMRKNKWGRIVTFSMNGAVTRKTTENTGIDYIIGKNARTWMALAVGNDEYDNGVTFNIIEPGPVDHIKNIDDAIAPIEGDTKVWEKREKPNAQDGAEAIAYLCSEAGRFVSQTIIRFPTDHW
jgi:NAD(P)-dependent dehydrogenase (short-subunit alcohol dehydrogenase family)